MCKEREKKRTPVEDEEAWQKEKSGNNIRVDNEDIEAHALQRGSLVEHIEPDVGALCDNHRYEWHHISST